MGNLDIFPFISRSDIVSDNELDETDENNNINFEGLNIYIFTSIIRLAVILVIMSVSTIISDIILYTIKPVLRGHLWEKKKWPYKTGDLLKEVQFI
jgi:hypothetical protein